MDNRFPGVRALVVSVLVAYFLLGLLTTGGVIAPALVLVLVVILWFLLYKLRHRSLGNRGLLTKMRADLERTLEDTKEKMAHQEAQILATAEHEEQAHLERERRRAERERRRASSPPKDPAVSKYAELIESRVRERQQARRESEGR